VSLNAYSKFKIEFGLGIAECFEMTFINNNTNYLAWDCMFYNQSCIF